MNFPENLLDRNGELLFSGFFYDKCFSYNRLDLKKILRLKEWDRYIIYNENYAFEICVSVLSPKLNVSLCFLDFIKKKVIKHSFRKITTLDNFVMPSSPKYGDIGVSGKKYSISLKRNHSAKLIKCNYVNFDKNNNLLVNVWLNEENKSDCAFIVPVRKNKSDFIYTQDINPIFANGIIRLGDISIDLENKNSFVAFNWGRGSFDYGVIKNLSVYRGTLSALIDGVIFGFHISYSPSYFGQNDNTVTFGEKLYKQRDICIHRNKTGAMKSWTLFSSDGRFEMKFKPFFSHLDKRKIGFHSFTREKFFGFFYGQVILGKKPVFIKNLPGIIEEERF